jgi:hypothetical protein
MRTAVLCCLVALKRASLVVVLLACTISSSHAQSTRRPNTRHGLWAGVGLGAGSAEMDCSSCSNFRFTGLSGYIRAGVTLTRFLLVGVETDGWVRSSSDVDDRVGFASLVLVWYPIPSGALYVKAGYGGMQYHSDESGDVLTAKARSVSLGLGYEVRVRRDISLVPFVNGLVTSSVQQYRNEVPVGFGNDFSLTLVQFGLGVTWH